MAGTLTLHGISNCDTVKRARAWLDARGQAYHFHDFKRDGVPTDALQRWVAVLGWETVLNRRGTTWRKLDTATQAQVLDGPSAVALMVKQPSLIKRPLMHWPNGKLSVGFDAAAWEQETRSG